ncbi:MAG: 16S rRNA (cytidine(1402)-2'-O)-methyltransferase [Myxococcota bacterium]
MSGPGRLYVVATPIGNLEDITLRALRVLKEVDEILAEDTRHSKKLCLHHTIGTPLRSFHAHSSEEKLRAVVDRLQEGATLALISDAGTPLISDPGRELVERCRTHGIAVEPIPGPSAVMAALSVAGVASASFRFEGFLPRSGRRRREALQRIAEHTGASVFFEGPSRLGATLAELSDLRPDRDAAVCRELTKVHEEVRRGTLASLAEDFRDGARGEITVVVGEALAARESEADLDALVDEVKRSGVAPSEGARLIAGQSSLSRREAYRRLIDDGEENR